MSHKFYEPARPRLQRSELAVPGSSPKMFEKALNSSADYIFLDLEDAVSQNDKISAYESVYVSGCFSKNDNSLNNFPLTNSKLTFG